MKDISLKNGLELLGFTNIEVSDGYRDRTGFAERDGKLYYFSRRTDEDVIYFPLHQTVMYREARDKKDYGGAHSRNQYGLDTELFELGYRFSEPRTYRDYNHYANEEDRQAAEKLLAEVMQLVNKESYAL